MEKDNVRVLDLSSQVDLANKIIREIKEARKAALNDDLSNRFKVINIVGEEGCGKSTICNLVMSELKDWSFHFIENNSDMELPRGGIKIGKRIEMFPSPTFSVRLGIFTLGSSLRFQEADQIFHDVEKQFIREINKDYGNSIIFVDNFDNLDGLTQHFVRTLCNRDKIDNIYKFFPIVFIITSNSRVFKDVQPFNVKLLNKNEVIKLSKAYNKNLNNSEIENILKLSNGNINFVTNLLQIDNDYNFTIQNIIEKRLEDIRKHLKYDNYDKIEDICVCGAYFESGFTINQLKKIFTDINDEYFYKLFNALNNFCIISQRNQNYFYSVEQFKDELKNRKIDLRQLYFRRMYDFYSVYQNEDYNLRLKFSLELLKCGCSEYFDNALSMLFGCSLHMIYERKLLSEKELNEFLDNYSLISIPEELREILECLITNNLQLDILFDTNFHAYSILIRSEITILKLNYITCSNSRTIAVNETLASAIEIADLLKNNQSEIYIELRLRMAIVSLLINRSTLNEQVLKQISELKEVLRKYETKNKDLFIAYMMIINRKSSLFNGCDSSIRDLKDAISYNTNEKNVNELYKSYTNIIGLYAVSSRYMTDAYKNATAEVKRLIKDYAEIKFTHMEKLEHNLILNEYLSSCSQCNSDNELLSVTKKYYKKFKNLYSKYNLKVARLNMVSLMCRLNQKDALSSIDEFLRDNALMLSEDNFYKYYLNDMLLMLIIIKQDWEKAKLQYKRLSAIDCPPFNDCKRHLNKRLEAYKAIIENKVVCKNISSYDTLITDLYKNASFWLDYYFGSDESWAFYSKGFLLTDAQFFS